MNSTESNKKPTSWPDVALCAVITAGFVAVVWIIVKAVTS